MNNFDMPPRMKAAGMAVDQCRVAYFYWRRRADLARAQRNSLISALCIVGNCLLLRIVFGSQSETSTAIPFVEILIN